ncbi:MAG: RagB/SusD family nutrient uptake outer membrane protein [Leptolyngbya sp. SIO1D8]|nr:RagB/SusD family nutrient uptake outer membrane protein [Leptolyngbya sp. SIO1D8]
MKKYIYTLLIIITAISCSDFLEEESKGLLVSEAFYQNAEELDLAVTAIYNYIVDAAFNDQVTAATLGGQDITSLFNDFQEFDVFNATGDNAQTSRYWAETYRTIVASNDLILNYTKAEATELEKNQAAGQAYFARAYHARACRALRHRDRQRSRPHGGSVATPFPAVRRLRQLHG